MCVCVSVCMRLCVHVCKCVCARVQVCVCTCASVHVCAKVFMQSVYAFLCMQYIHVSDAAEYHGNGDH